MRADARAEWLLVCVPKSAAALRRTAALVACALVAACATFSVGIFKAAANAKTRQAPTSACAQNKLA